MDKQLFNNRRILIEDPGAITKLPYVLDHLLATHVLSQEEVDEATSKDTIQNKVRYVVDTVHRKGKMASSMLLDAWNDYQPPDDKETFYLTGYYTRSELMRIATSNTGRPSRLNFRPPVRVNLADPSEHVDDPVFRELELHRYERVVVSLVKDVLQNMHFDNVKEFMSQYSSNLRHANVILRDASQLSCLMLDYVHGDVEMYAERVYAKLSVCKHKKLANTFRNEVFRTCSGGANFM